jgi:hypothetical protein
MSHAAFGRAWGAYGRRESLLSEYAIVCTHIERIQTRLTYEMELRKPKVGCNGDEVYGRSPLLWIEVKESPDF